MKKEKLSLVKTPDQNFESNDGAGQQVEQHSLQGEVKVNEVFVELFVPFKNALDISGSYRFSDYSLSQKADTFDLGLHTISTINFFSKARRKKQLELLTYMNYSKKHTQNL